MRNRRGISSVVGTVFAIIALGSTVAYITYSMNVLDNYNQSVLARNQQSSDIVNEKFQVTSVKFANNKLNITVANTGVLPINFTKLWITNSSVPSGSASWVMSYAPQSSVVSPGNTLKNIGQSISGSINPNYAYQVKLVTSRGNTNQFNVNSANSQPLDIRLYALPPTIPSSFTTELVMFVVNNSTNGATYANIQPQLVDEGGTATASYSSTPTPASYPTLAPGESAYFKWDLTLTGNNGATRTFTAQLQNGFPGNTATTTVSIITVPVSLQSGTSLQSVGLSTSLNPDNVLVLHQETTTNPANAYEMWNAPAEAGVAKNVYTGTSAANTWITNNDTSMTETVVPGTWSVSLRYVSDLVPTNFPGADLIYHFESIVSGKTKDSSGNGDDLSITGSPTVQNSGVNGSNAIPLSGNSQYFSHAVDSHSNVVNSLATTAGWFKTSSPLSTQRSIFHIGSTASKPFYDISLSSSAKVVFSYSGFSSGGSVTTCTSSGSTRYDDGNWHHFVAVKTGFGLCSLYIDNLSAVTGGSSCSSCANAPPSNFYVGYDPTTSNSYFPGTVDDVIHWNNAQLTQSQVKTLTQKTSYGSNAHQLNIYLERTDSTGSNVEETIRADTPYNFPFYDPVTGGSSYNTQFNYTYSDPHQENFTGGDRLRLRVNWQSGMNMTMRIDDSTLSNPQTSFLQVPSVNNPFAGYFTYSLSSGGPSLWVTNAGPNSSWMSFMTRLSFKDIASTNSYGAMITTGNSELVSPYRDSPLFKVSQSQQLVFTTPSDPPCLQPYSQGFDNTCKNPVPTTIPVGHYRLNAFLSGYDELGNIFLRTIYLGVCNVTP